MGLADIINPILGKLPENNPFGIVAQFENPAELYHAAEAVRDAGYKKWDVYSPYPIHGMNKAMGIRRSVLPWICLGGGLTGFSAGLGLQLWVNLSAYPLVISGKPYASIPAFMPVTFELTVLFSALSAVFGMLILNMLPMLYHPLFKNADFAKVTKDGFFLSIDARDPKFNAETTRRLLEKIGGTHIALLEP